ncbi:MAG: glycosyltransferase, partial [Candidatus Micrarchaeia archaeon]
EPDNKEVILKSGKVLIELEQIESAKNLYESYLKKHPEDEEIKEVLEKSKTLEFPKLEREEIKGQDIKVSAIVSTYNSERFIRGCLEDLISQTLYEKGQLEIIVVDSGSEQNEKAIVEEFQKRYKNIKYIRTDKRETVYSAWNRGIKIAKGKYITNANTDDRHRKDALEIMADYLDKNPEFALVYGDSIVTERENETFDNCTPVGYFALPEFDRERLLHESYIGPQPMWRKNLHDELGFFDETFEVAGDYEWWLRVSERYLFKHIKDLLGLYLFSAESLEHSKQVKSQKEVKLIQEYYSKRMNVKLNFNKYGRHYLVPSYPTVSSDNLTKPLFAAVYCVYNDETWLKESVLSIYNDLDAIYFLISDRPWYGEKIDNSGTLEIISSFSDPDNKIRIIYGNWTNETEQRNAGLDILKKDGFTYCFIIDADEVYDPIDLRRILKLVRENPNIDCWYINLDTYWKSYEYRIEPREPLTPLIILKIGILRFFKNRIVKGGISALIPEDFGICHHLSYARSDEEVLEKIRTFSHAYEVKTGWFEKIWKKWDNDNSLTNLHPTHPHCYHRAVKQDYAKLPCILKKRYVKDKNSHKIVKGLVSIIILTYNLWEQTKLCLESIEKHTPEKHEVIIVDNGSNDKTIDELRKLIKIKKNIKVISNSINYGFAIGNNLGIALAKGEFILFLNNDTIVTNGWLRRMLDIFNKFSKVGLVGPMSNYVSGPQQVPWVNYSNIQEIEEFAEDWFKKNSGESFQVYRAVGFCLLVKREIIDLIGGFDDSFSYGNFEDDDFCIRASLYGYEARIAKDVFIHHTGGQTFQIMSMNYEDILLKNWEIFKLKWGVPLETEYGKGYPIPNIAPPGVKIFVPIPDLSEKYEVKLEGRWWTEKEKTDLTSIIIFSSNNKGNLKRCLKNIKKHTSGKYEVLVLAD